MAENNLIDTRPFAPLALAPTLGLGLDLCRTALHDVHVTLVTTH